MEIIVEEQRKRLGEALSALDKQGVKVDTIWSFQMRRAISETVVSECATKNSPLTFNADAQSRLDGIKEELRAFHESRLGLSDGEMLLEIERSFGERLLTLVCIPCNLTHGACLLLALSVARGTNTLELNL